MREKPVYLNLFAFAFPITAIVSILHRVSGLLLFLFIPSLLLLFQNLYAYPEVMQNLKLCWYLKLSIWLGLTALIYHLCAGIRHLIMDTGYGEDKTSARISSYVVLALTVLGSILCGVKLC